MSLTCSISTGIKKSCALNTSGVKSVAVINFSDLEDINSVSGLADGIVTSTDFSSWVKSGKKFYEWEVARDTGNATSALTQGSNPDAKSITDTVVGHLNGIIGYETTSGGTTTRVDLRGDELTNIVLSDLVVAVRRNDGRIEFYGAYNGLSVTQFDESTGASATDANGFDFTLTGVQSGYPLLADSSLTWDTIIA